LSTVAILGAGAIGGAVARGFASCRDVSRIWLFDLDERRLEVAAADASAIAIFRETYAEVRYRIFDVRHEDQLATTLDAVNPDVLVNSATLQSPWALNDLAAATLQELELGARFGPWLPVNLVIPLKLMRARASAGLSTPVVNISFPDAVNAVLGSMGLAPTCGAGNSDLLVAGIKPLAAEWLGVPPAEVDVYMSAHHFHVHLFTSGLDEVESLDDYPFWIRVTLRGEDVTDQLGGEKLVAEAARRMPRGRASAATAESVVKNGLRLLRDDPTLTHAPGPIGHGGGFDVRLRRDDVEILWPDGVSRDEVNDMHLRAQRGDGIEEIAPGGIVTFTERAESTMRDVLGYECRVLNPEDFESRAEELSQRLRERILKDRRTAAERDG
jgi:hypothetical protein